VSNASDVAGTVDMGDTAMVTPQLVSPHWHRRATATAIHRDGLDFVESGLVGSGGGTRRATAVRAPRVGIERRSRCAGAGGRR
jgi:hypothetical protein